MDDNKLNAELRDEKTMQLEAKLNILEIALKQKDTTHKHALDAKDKILKHIVSEKDLEIDKWKNLYLASNQPKFSA